MSAATTQQIWSLHYRLISETIATVTPEIEGAGVEIKELFVLGEVEEFPNPAKLADRLCYPRPTVTVYLKRLESAGLVKREIDAEDLRRHRMLITAKGRKVLAAGMGHIMAAYSERLSHLSAAEQSQLMTLMSKMV